MFFFLLCFAWLSVHIEAKHLAHRLSKPEDQGEVTYTRTDPATNLPVDYYQIYGDSNPSKAYKNVSCKDWRTSVWPPSRLPDHDLMEVETQTYVIGIGHSKSGTTDTFGVLSSNPAICYYRNPDTPGFRESHALFKYNSHSSSSMDRDIFLAHLAPAHCCKASVMKDPNWAFSHQIPYLMKNIFKENTNLKFILTIREPIQAIESLLNYRCINQGTCSLATHVQRYNDTISFSDKVDRCLKAYKHQDYKERTNLQHAKALDACNQSGKDILLQYDHRGTFQRYADVFGAESIFCQFFSDYERNSKEVRREVLDFAGLSSIDPNDFVFEDTAYDASHFHQHNYKYTYTNAEKIGLTQKVEELYGVYDEAALRKMCVHSSFVGSVEAEQENVV